MSSNLFRVVYGHLTKLSEVVSADKKREALKKLEKYPNHVRYYFGEGILTEEEAKPYALKDLENNSYYLRDYFDKGLLTKEEAKPYALKSLEAHPDTVTYYFEHDIITKKEAMPYVLKVLKGDLTKAPTYLNIKNSEGIKLLTPSEARPYALEHLKTLPSLGMGYHGMEVITDKEAKLYALRHLKSVDETHFEKYLDKYVERRILTEEEADQIMASREGRKTDSMEMESDWKGFLQTPHLYYF